MKRKLFKWKYMLASLLLANIAACSNDGIPQVDLRQEHVHTTRTTELVTQKVELKAAGTLQEKLTEAMGDSAVSTLQKLVVSGPFTSTDMTFVYESLTSLIVIDMKDAEIKASDIPHRGIYFQDNQICETMFFDMNLEEVVLPNTVTEIGKAAFYECEYLRSVVIPDQVKAIRQEAFGLCRSLSAINLPSSLEVLEKYAFMLCGLTSVVIPERLKNIEYGAFMGCGSLTSAILPSGLEKIGSYAFSSCSLTSVVIPEGVKEIEDNAFDDCTSLSSVILPTSLEKIGNSAFEDCSFNTIDLPVGLKEIGSYVFQSCMNLKKLTIPESVESVQYHFITNSDIKSLIWNPSIDVPSCWGVDNCYLFVNTDQIGVNNVNEWKAIVINGFVETDIDVNTGNWNGEFANLTEFTAKKLVYSKHFGNETVPGGSSGWQTIVLPFTPDSIYHETKGQIAPFNSGIEGAKPFWLRELTSEGFVDVTKIEAHKPYIIAMPNHDTYLEEYRLNGNITFVAKNAVMTVTPETLQPSVGPEFELHPTYKYVEQSDAVYALGTVWGYYEEENMYYSKSFFRKNSRSVEKFNAYVTPLDGGRSSRSLFSLDTRSKATRTSGQPNTSGIPQIGDM